jgi:exopolysaccharide biosynthesis polyprenyl glycosylphosphotransferase
VAGRTEGLIQKPLLKRADRETPAAGANGKRRVLIVGAGARGQDIARELLEHKNGKLELVGFVDDHDLPRFDGVPILGRFDQVLELVSAHDIDEIIVAYMPSWREELIKGAMQRGVADRIRIKVLPGFYDAMVGECEIERVEDIPLVRLNGRSPRRTLLAAKRAFDLTFSILGLLVAFPVLLIAALAIKLSSRGPVFFCQERVGYGGRRFRIYKLRSMVMDAERDTGPVLAQEYDERITWVGRLLRKTRIDEIPQFWNVLRGDMSIVGPRPERPEFAEQFAAEIPGYAERHKIRPGITGLAQVYGDYLTSVYHKLRYDWIYLHRMSAWQDLRILAMTVVTVLTRAGT